jgi:hypothetical protein
VRKVLYRLLQHVARSSAVASHLVRTLLLAAMTAAAKAVHHLLLPGSQPPNPVAATALLPASPTPLVPALGLSCKLQLACTWHSQRRCQGC